jgi:two-component system response regulator AtoC
MGIENLQQAFVIPEKVKKRSRIIAESPLMKRVLEASDRVAKSSASVFISGESGTGKEVVAQAIHFQSERAERPFIKVNCAAIPDTLIESEFFGHEKGAFTGALNRRLGRFELAHEGTLLLDEVTEIPISLQPKLLRAIQEQEFERVGGILPIKVDVRIIATSNRKMKEAVDQKVFREDLFYRLNVVPLHIPPLRERREDILPLAQYFLEQFCQENRQGIRGFSDEERRQLLDYGWPGNIRELANVIERTVIMGSELIIDPSLSTIEIVENSSFQGLTLYEVEKRHILETLAAMGNSRTKAAQKLGISIRTLRNKLNEYTKN